MNLSSYNLFECIYHQVGMQGSGGHHHQSHHHLPPPSTCPPPPPPSLNYLPVNNSNTASNFCSNTSRYLPVNAADDSGFSGSTVSSGSYTSGNYISGSYLPNNNGPSAGYLANNSNGRGSSPGYLQNNSIINSNTYSPSNNGSYPSHGNSNGRGSFSGGSSQSSGSGNSFPGVGTLGIPPPPQQFAGSPNTFHLHQQQLIQQHQHQQLQQQFQHQQQHQDFRSSPHLQHQQQNPQHHQQNPQHQQQNPQQQKQNPQHHLQNLQHQQQNLQHQNQNPQQQKQNHQHQQQNPQPLQKNLQHQQQNPHHQQQQSVLSDHSSRSSISSAQRKSLNNSSPSSIGGNNMALGNSLESLGQLTQSGPNNSCCVDASDGSISSHSSRAQFNASNRDPEAITVLPSTSCRDSDPSNTLASDSEVLRESFMVKRSQNRSRFGPTNWRERWFVLTPTHIIYYDGDRQVRQQVKHLLRWRLAGSSAGHTFIVTETGRYVSRSQI